MGAMLTLCYVLAVRPSSTGERPDADVLALVPQQQQQQLQIAFPPPTPRDEVVVDWSWAAEAVAQFLVPPTVSEALGDKGSAQVWPRDGGGKAGRLALWHVLSASRPYRYNSCRIDDTV
jgi:hypothetical protein